MSKKNKRKKMLTVRATVIQYRHQHTGERNMNKTYEISEEMGHKDGEAYVAAYLVVTRIDGVFNWSERFSTMAEAQNWVDSSVA